MAYKKGLHGLGFKAWSMCRKSLSLVFPFAVGHLNKMFSRGAGIWTEQSSKVQIPGGNCPGEIARGGCWGLELMASLLYSLKWLTKDSNSWIRVGNCFWVLWNVSCKEKESSSCKTRKQDLFWKILSSL